MMMKSILDTMELETITVRPSRTRRRRKKTLQCITMIHMANSVVYLTRFLDRLRL